jgi:hypothetical protein
MWRLRENWWKRISVFLWSTGYVLRTWPNMKYDGRFLCTYLISNFAKPPSVLSVTQLHEFIPCSLCKAHTKFNTKRNISWFTHSDMQTLRFTLPLMREICKWVRVSCMRQTKNDLRYTSQNGRLRFKYQRNKQTNELYRPSDCRLSAKLVPNLVNRGCRVVSATNPHGR